LWQEEPLWLKVELADREFGGLAVLVNNAGILGRAPLVREDPREFERLWRVNCLGLLLGMQAAVAASRTPRSWGHTGG
jgi:3alpha(or 20beta)-hydroxysteroid dehydrogenase